MQDPVTDIPPPSRLDADDLNNFATPANHLWLPQPFVVWRGAVNAPPKLLVVALSNSACHLVHQLPSKTLVGSLVLPEVSMAGNTAEPSMQDKTCLLYAPLGNPTVIFASVQYAVVPERATVWAKVLLREVRPDAVLILGFIPSLHFRGRLSADETLIFKLETLAQRSVENDNSLHDVPYFPPGSVVDGASAALLTQCQIRKLKGRLLVSWPAYDAEVVKLLSLLLNRVCPGVDFRASAMMPLFKLFRVESELYT